MELNETVETSLVNGTTIITPVTPRRMRVSARAAKASLTKVDFTSATAVPIDVDVNLVDCSAVTARVSVHSAPISPMTLEAIIQGDPFPARVPHSIIDRFARNSSRCGSFRVFCICVLSFISAFISRGSRMKSGIVQNY